MKSTMKIVLDGYPFKRYRWEDGKFGFREPNYRALRLHLIEEYGVCYFCGIEVKDYPRVDGENAKPDLATIDHLIPRPHNKQDGRRRFEVVEKVLACYKCNSVRNDKYQKGEIYATR